MNNLSKYLIGAVSLILVLLAFYYLGDIFAYIIVAWVVSMIGSPLSNFLRKYMNKGLAAGITISTIIIGFGLILWLMVPPVLNQVNHLSEIDYDKVLKNIEEPINDWNDWLETKGFKLNSTDSIEDLETIARAEEPKHLINYDTLFQSGIIDTNSQVVTIVLQVEKEIIKPKIVSTPISNKTTQEILIKARSYLLSIFNPQNIPTLFGSLFGLAGTIMVYILAIVFIGFFFLKEQGLFGRMITMWVPNRHNTKVYRAIDETSGLLVRYFIGVAIQVSIITIYVSVLLTIFGVKNGLMIGFLVGLINVIPYIGPMIGWVFGIVILLSSSIDLSFYEEILPKIGILTGVIASMQLLDNLVLQPNIFSRSIKAHPVEIFIVILVAAKLGGILGMVLAIPIYTVFRVIARVFLGRFEVLSKIAKGLSEEATK